MISVLEQRMKDLLNIALPNEEYLDNYRPDWLKNPATGMNLEIDRYYPRLKIGFEFNGKQHHKKNDILQWNRDNLKKKLCGKEGVIKLVVYKKDLNISIIRSKIQDSIDMRKAWSEHKSFKRTS